MPRYGLYKAAFEALALPGVPGTLRRFSAARGLIFTLHRVLPDAPAPFAPNSILQIRPDFLEAVILRARKAGFDIVDLDEAARRIIAEGAKPFIVLTFDDGYRDNLVHALPILRKHAAPFTLYIPTGLIDGVGLVWWQALEDIIAANDVVVFEMPEGPYYGDGGTLEQKSATFAQVYERYRKMPEIEQSANVLEAQFGKRPKHLSYPIGGVAAAGPREFAAATDLGFAPAVTTRPGGLYAEHAAHMNALPRVSLNGLFQEKRFIDVFLTAEVFTLMRRGRRLDVE